LLLRSGETTAGCVEVDLRTETPEDDRGSLAFTAFVQQATPRRFMAKKNIFHSREAGDEVELLVNNRDSR